MNLDYIAGYFDGEGCMLLGVHRDKRLVKTKGSLIDGWAITPILSIQSYDYKVMEVMREFWVKGGFGSRKIMDVTKQVRPHQTKIAKRFDVAGWDKIRNACLELIPRCIAKRKQLELFLELYDITQNLPPIGYKNHPKWTKELFVTAMLKVDEINKLKSRKRGKYNARYFKELWGLN